VVNNGKTIRTYVFSSTGWLKPSKTCKITANNLLGFEPGTSEYKSRAVALAGSDLHSGYITK
jgi:hypothetical protein